MQSKRPLIPLERLNDEALIASVAPFTTATPTQVRSLAASLTRSQKAARAVVLRRGTVSDGLYVVLRGRVNLVRAADGGRDLILASLGPGDVFGTGCVLDAAPSTTAAVCATQCELARLPEELVSALISENATVGMHLLKLVHARLADVEAVASGLALCDVEERLRRTLTQLARRQGRPEPSYDGWILAPVPTQSELARMVGSCRETVSRTLSALAREGHLSSSGRRMLLKESFMQSAVTS